MNFEAQADYEYAREVGRSAPQQCWIVSDRDAIYRNPFYVGPPVRHPDDWGFDDEPADGAVLPAAQIAPAFDDGSDDIPF